MERYLRIILLKPVEKNLVDRGVQEINIFLARLIRYVDICINEINCFFNAVIVSINVVYCNRFRERVTRAVAIEVTFNDNSRVLRWHLKVKNTVLQRPV